MEEYAELNENFSDKLAAKQKSLKTNYEIMEQKEVQLKEK